MANPNLGAAGVRRGAGVPNTLRRAVMLLLVTGTSLYAGVAGASATGATNATGSTTAPAAGPTSDLTGRVVSAATHRPVAGASVRAQTLGIAATTTRDGRFALRAIPAAYPYRRVEVVVTAAGYASWTITGAPLYPGDALILNVELRSTPFIDRVLTPQERAASTPSAAQGSAVPQSGTCSDWNYQQVPPPMIWVLRLATGVSEQYDFLFYAAHVLPNEWISSWDADALGAGAIAVRTYAAWHEIPGNSYSSGTNCADVRDSVDGLFDPSWTTAQAELAVQAAWGSIVYQNGGLFVAHYFAGSKTDPCGPILSGQFAGWMAQWGTQTCALTGMLYPDIVDTYYGIPGKTMKWYYTNDLLLNPNVNSAGMYPWASLGNTTFARTKGTGDGDSWYLHVIPTLAGRNAIVYQLRPYDGIATTTYQAQVSLRCADSGASACAVTIKVVTIPPAGAATYRSMMVSVPNDGAWHVYTFDPSAAGGTHTAVKLSTVSLQPFDLDTAVLTSPYGGP